MRTMASPQDKSNGAAGSDVAKTAVSDAASRAVPVLAPAGQRTLQVGDWVLFYGNIEMIVSQQLAHGEIMNCKFGGFHHDDIIGKKATCDIPADVHVKWGDVDL